MLHYYLTIAFVLTAPLVGLGIAVIESRISERNRFRSHYKGSK